MTESSPILILGTGGNCVDIAEAIEAGGGVCAGFLDDEPALQGQTVGRWPVLGSLSAASDFSAVRFVNGIGSPTSFREKAKIIARTGIADDGFATVVHPTAWVSPSATLEPGVVLLSHVTIASGARLGRHVIILPQSVVSHDTTIGDFGCIAGGVVVNGNVDVAVSCYLGARSSILGHLRVGEGALIGMGAVVVHDVRAGSTVVGNPARPLGS